MKGMNVFFDKNIFLRWFTPKFVIKNERNIKTAKNLNTKLF